MEYQEYMELRQKQIESKDFAETCRKALVRDRGEIPVVDQIKMLIANMKE